MGFEKITRKLEPKIRFYRSNVASLSAGATRTLNFPEYVEVLWNPDTKNLAILPATLNTHERLTLTLKMSGNIDTNTRMIGCGQIRKAMGREVFGSFDGKWDETLGGLVFDLSEAWSE